MSETDHTLLQLLDDAVAHLENRHFTFTDEEALALVWEEGYDFALQEDPLARFVLAAEAQGGKHRRQWRLRTQTLANNRLLDALVAGAWDGREIEVELHHLSAEDQVHYVFCSHDARFSTSPDGRLEPADRERLVPLPLATRADLDALAPALWQYWQEDGAHPLTIRHITELLARLGWSDANERNAWTIARSWLLTRSEVMRAGPDYWILTTTVPQEPARTRLHVLPITTTQSQLEEGSASDTASPALPDAPRDNTTSSIHPRVEVLEKQQIVQGNVPVTSPVNWHQPLRTIHLLEGFLPVPAKARSAYPPRAVGAEDIQVVSGLWFESGDRLWLWLDRQHDRLYGPDLARQLEWLEPGDILRVVWRSDAITLDKDGHDDEVQREESRLVDLEELKALRGGLGESYRQSLQIILSTAPDGLTFAQLVVALRERQGHIVHHGTIRALLYTGGFVHRQHLWFAAPDTTIAARKLRSALIETIQPDEPIGLDSEAMSEPERRRKKVQAIKERLAQVVQELRDASS